jgi:hypothetical protein
LIIDISSSFAASLREAENFRGFHVELDVPKTSLSALRAKLGDLADWPDEGVAWISVATLRRLPGVIADPVWDDGLATMIEKARPHGWIREHPVPAIRAHLVWKKD